MFTHSPKRLTKLLPIPSSVASDPSLLAAVSHVIQARRSNLRVDPERPIPADMLDCLLELAVWAPNHKHTHPWRFCIVTADGRARLGEAVARTLLRQGRIGPEVVDAIRAKYLRAPVVLVVGSAVHEEPALHAENRDAVAAGVQNLLLGATALGLASFWASPSAPDDTQLKQMVGLGPEDQLVAIVYLGWPTAASPPARRDAPVVTVLDG